MFTTSRYFSNPAGPVYPSGPMFEVPPDWKVLSVKEKVAGGAKCLDVQYAMNEIFQSVVGDRLRVIATIRMLDKNTFNLLISKELKALKPHQEPEAPVTRIKAVMGAQVAPMVQSGSEDCFDEIESVKETLNGVTEWAFHRMMTPSEVYLRLLEREGL